MTKELYHLVMLRAILHSTIPVPAIWRNAITIYVNGNAPIMIDAIHRHIRLQLPERAASLQ